ncbi:MAG: hypothetical protein RID91_11115 [Azospirillaceae bacterium]
MVAPLRLCPGGRAPSLAIPDWLASADPADPTAPRLVLAESAGPNAADLFAATALAAEDAGIRPVVAIGDDRRDPDAARAVAHEAAAVAPDAVIGHFGSRTAMAAGEVYGNAGIAFLAPGSSADDLCGPDRPTTRQIFGRDAEQRAVLEAAARSAGPAILILGERDNYGAGLARDLSGAVAGDPAVRTATVRILDRYGAGGLPRDEAGPGAAPVFLLGSQDFATAVVDSGRLPRAGVLVFSDDSHGAPVVERPDIAPRAATVFLDRPGTRLVDRAASDIRERAAARLGRAPGPYLETTYLAVRAVLDAWSPADGRARRRVLDTIDAAVWETPYGRLRLDAQGRLAGHRWCLWHRGRAVEPAAVAAAGTVSAGP